MESYIDNDVILENRNACWFQENMQEPKTVEKDQRMNRPKNGSRFCLIDHLIVNRRRASDLGSKCE